MSYVVGIENGGVVISRGLECVLTLVTSLEAYSAYFVNEGNRLGIDNLTVYFSSSMDFPTESTSDPKVLALVATLNNLYQRS